MDQTQHPAAANLLGLVDLLYAVCDDLSRWPVFLRRLVRATSARLAYVHEIDLAAGTDTALVATPPDQDLLERFERHSGPGDSPFLAEPIRASLGVGRVLSDREPDPGRRIEQTDFFRRFLQPNGLTESLTVVFDADDGRFRALSLLGPEPFAAPDGELLVGLANHLRRCLRLSGLLEGAQRLHLALQDTVERVPIGLMLFDRDGRLVLANWRARRLLGKAEGFGLDRDGRPESPDPEVTAELRRLLGSATDRSQAEAKAASGHLMLPRFADRRPLSVLVSSIPVRSPKASDAFAAVFLSDPEDRLAPRVELLQERCGLTPTEARVAALMVQGQSVEEVAAALDSSLHTIRTHLKRIFAKTGTHRQASLVSLLVNAVGALDSGGH